MKHDTPIRLRFALRFSVALVLLACMTAANDAFPRTLAGGGFEERHERVVRELERTQRLWEEVNARVEQTSAATVRNLVEQAARVQRQAQHALQRAESVLGEDSGRADEQLRASLTLTLRARDMTTRAARQLREDLSQEESARRMLERVRSQHERLRQNDATRRSPLWDQATQLLEQARLQWREGNFEQALRLAQNASNVLGSLEEREGGAVDIERVRAELQRVQEHWQRMRDRTGDRRVPQLDQAGQLLREARQALADDRIDLAVERIRAARRLLASVGEREVDGQNGQIERALERLDAQIERFAERMEDRAPHNAQRLLRQAMDERDRARRALHAGNEEQTRQHIRAAADLLARIQRQLGARD